MWASGFRCLHQIGILVNRRNGIYSEGKSPVPTIADRPLISTRIPVAPKAQPINLPSPGLMCIFNLFTVGITLLRSGRSQRAINDSATDQQSS